MPTPKASHRYRGLQAGTDQQNNKNDKNNIAPSPRPTRHRTRRPSAHPTRLPTGAPTSTPSEQPSFLARDTKPSLPSPAPQVSPLVAPLLDDKDKSPLTTSTSSFYDVDHSQRERRLRTFGSLLLVSTILFYSLLLYLARRRRRRKNKMQQQMDDDTFDDGFDLASGKLDLIILHTASMDESEEPRVQLVRGSPTRPDGPERSPERNAQLPRPSLAAYQEPAFDYPVAPEPYFRTPDEKHHRAPALRVTKLVRSPSTIVEEPDTPDTAETSASSLNSSQNSSSLEDGVLPGIKETSTLDCSAEASQDSDGGFLLGVTNKPDPPGDKPGTVAMYFA